jgi:hypothetical protein
LDEAVRPSNGHSRSNALQRSFSSFPGSWQGAALLLLRAVVGATAAIQGGSYLADIAGPTVATWALGLLAIASGMALIAGFLTPASGAIAGLATVLIAATWTPTLASSLLIDRVAALFVIADATAVALLGPGAHSIDAYFFGRREIIIPHESQSR